LKQGGALLPLLCNFALEYAIRGVQANQVKKGKAIPLKAWTGPCFSRGLRLPDFKIIGA
jgi:hypothetical protein